MLNPFDHIHADHVRREQRQISMRDMPIKTRRERDRKRYAPPVAANDYTWPRPIWPLWQFLIAGVVLGVALVLGVVL